MLSDTYHDPYMATKIIIISPESNRCSCGGGLPQCVTTITQDRWKRILKFSEDNVLRYVENNTKDGHPCVLEVDINRLIRKCKILEHTGHTSCVLFDTIKSKQFVNAVETAIARVLVNGQRPPVPIPEVIKVAPAAVPLPVMVPVAVPMVAAVAPAAAPPAVPAQYAYLSKFPNRLMYFKRQYIADAAFAGRYSTPEWLRLAELNPRVMARRRAAAKLDAMTVFIWGKLKTDRAMMKTYEIEYNAAKKLWTDNRVNPKAAEPDEEVEDDPEDEAVDD